MFRSRRDTQPTWTIPDTLLRRLSATCSTAQHACGNATSRADIYGNNTQRLASDTFRIFTDSRGHGGSRREPRNGVTNWQAMLKDVIAGENPDLIGNSKGVGGHNDIPPETSIRWAFTHRLSSESSAAIHRSDIVRHANASQRRRSPPRSHVPQSLSPANAFNTSIAPLAPHKLKCLEY